jgi:glycerol-3-phosphate dehydrogenase
MLADCVEIAAKNGTHFQFFNYHQAYLRNSIVTISPAASAASATSQPAVEPNVGEIAPAALVNAAGAWVDRAWSELDVPAPRYMGGTKGSHCFTFHVGLRAALAGRGVYAEASDGRPVFITPLGDATLIGTTDEPFEQDPAEAVAREDEVDYLLAAANAIFPAIGLSRSDIAFTYSGVRPLPHANAATPGAITRRHVIARRDVGALPSYSIIGGKLTTCRSLAEEAAARILSDLGLPVIANTRQRLIPGAEGYPADAAALSGMQAGLASEFKLPLESIEASWRLLGARTRAALSQVMQQPALQTGDSELIPGTRLPCAIAVWMIRHEWVVTLDDLVERRLMLLYEPHLSRRTLERLAELLVAENRLSAAAVATAVEATAARLLAHFGKRLES